MFSGVKLRASSLRALRGKRRIRHQAQQSYQQPVPMDIRVPVEASVKCGRQFARRTRVRIAVHRQTDVIGIFIVQAFERQTRESRRRGRIHRRPRRSCLRVAAKLIEDKLKRAANNAIGRMRGFLRVAADADLSAAARGAWLGRCKDRRASSVWDSGPSDPSSPRGSRDSKSSPDPW